MTGYFGAELSKEAVFENGPTALSSVQLTVSRILGTFWTEHSRAGQALDLGLPIERLETAGPGIRTGAGYKREDPFSSLHHQ